MSFRELEIRSIDFINDTGDFSLLETIAELRRVFPQMADAVDAYGSTRAIVDWEYFLDDLQEFVEVRKIDGLVVCVNERGRDTSYYFYHDVPRLSLF